jgi:hypothetical protein
LLFSGTYFVCGATLLPRAYPIEKIEQYLTAEEKQVLYPRRKLYIWGNQPGKKDSWNKMQIGDLVAFYAKGEFVYVGKCILKKQSDEIGRELWGNVPQKEYTWGFIFFLDEIRPISIPLSAVRALGGYKEKMVVQGFMPINEEGMRNLLNTYGSLVAFFDAYSSGLNSKDVAILDEVSEKEVLNDKETVDIDAITRDKNLDLLLAEWQQRKSSAAPEEIEKRIKAIKRNISIVRKMKEKYKNECQICGFTFKQANGNFYSEVAHIKPIATKKAGVDAPANMMVLCPNHHKMLDLGNLEIISPKEYQIENQVLLLREPMIESDQKFLKKEE